MPSSPTPGTDSSRTELYAALQSVFSPFGKVIDLVTAKTYKLRGQAWVVFDSEVEAERALAALQGFVFYDKPMVWRSYYYIVRSEHVRRIFALHG